MSMTKNYIYRKKPTFTMLNTDTVVKCMLTIEDCITKYIIYLGKEKKQHIPFYDLLTMGINRLHMSSLIRQKLCHKFSTPKSHVKGYLQLPFK